MANSQENLVAALKAPADRVVIERLSGESDGVFVISDEEGEFARAGDVAGALHYAADLLYGPATSPRGTVWNLLRAMEKKRDE